MLCDSSYSTEMYRNAYSILFHPVPNKRFWPRHAGPTLLPLALREKKRGRPKSTRICNSMDMRETSVVECKCPQCNELSHYNKMMSKVAK
jgi:hypothetical protein